MFNSVQYVRDICKQRGIPISQLEKDCGFSNGYLNPKKMAKLPYDRAQTIAEYLGITAEVILTGEETEKAPTVSGRRCIDCNDNPNRNIVRIAGRNGSYEERILTDEQVMALKAILGQMPDASGDL